MQRIAALLCSLGLTLSGAAQAACEDPGQGIDEQSFVPINGIEQWVTIKGERCANPVVLMVHGGPGNPLTPFAHKLFGAWEKEFTIVHWDQRGSGMTYSRKPIAKLEALGAPPWTNPRAFGIARRIDRKVEAQVTDPAPKSWWQPAPQYTTARYEADYTAGEDYSFLHFVGYKGDGMFSRYDLYRMGTRFALPVYFVMGQEDLLPSPQVARRYFDAIEAPAKDFIVVPRAGHDPNQPMMTAQLQVLRRAAAAAR